MSIEHIKQLIKDHMSPVVLMERLEPYITTDELLDFLEDFIEVKYPEVFEEELEQYYESE